MPTPALSLGCCFHIDNEPSAGHRRQPARPCLAAAPPQGLWICKNCTYHVRRTIRHCITSQATSLFEMRWVCVRLCTHVKGIIRHCRTLFIARAHFSFLFTRYIRSRCVLTCVSLRCFFLFLHFFSFRRLSPPQLLTAAAREGDEKTGGRHAPFEVRAYGVRP